MVNHVLIHKQMKFQPGHLNGTVYISTDGYPTQTSYEYVYYLGKEDSPIFLPGQVGVTVWYYVMMYAVNAPSNVIGMIHQGSESL